MRQEFLGFYKKLQKSRKRMLLRSFLFALFLIGVNIFAWFTYVSKAGLQLEGNISSWDVEFNANGKPTTKVDFYVSDMKPGMLDYSQKVIIHNLGEVSADVSYDIASLSIIGRDVDVSNKDEIIRRLISFYPFSVNLNIDSVIIQPQGYTNFSASLSWDYENQEKFYQLDSLYDYNGEFNYYNLVDGKYVVNYKPAKKLPVEEFLKPQKRFKHMFKPGNEWMIEEFQKEVDKRWQELLDLEEITNKEEN